MEIQHLLQYKHELIEIEENAWDKCRRYRCLLIKTIQIESTILFVVQILITVLRFLR